MLCFSMRDLKNDVVFHVVHEIIFGRWRNKSIDTFQK